MAATSPSRGFVVVRVGCRVVVVALVVLALIAMVVDERSVVVLVLVVNVANDALGRACWLQGSLLQACLGRCLRLVR
jgi:hypothetical protein